MIILRSRIPSTTTNSHGVSCYSETVLKLKLIFNDVMISRNTLVGHGTEEEVLWLVMAQKKKCSGWSWHRRRSALVGHGTEEEVLWLVMAQKKKCSGWSWHRRRSALVGHGTEEEVLWLVMAQKKKCSGWSWHRRQQKSVILPTIWRYLQILGAPPYFLGLSLSAFSLSGLLAGPFFGQWSDRTRTTKNIILFANLFEVVGNFMYFMNFDKWLLLSSRLVAGIGTGAGASIFGYLTRSTAPEDRSTVFAAVMACRQAGLLIGPACNIFLRLCNFQLGPFVVNKFTAPGLFMCLLWILLQLAVLLMYWDLPPEDSASCIIRDVVDVEEESEKEPLVGAEEPSGSYGTVCPSPSEPLPNGTLPHSSPPSSHSELPGQSNPFRNFNASRGGFQWQLTEFIIGVFLQVLGLPFVAVAQVSLFSKVTAEKTQGFSQGIRRSVGGLATILGPLWAGGLTENLYVMLGVMMVLLMLLTIMMVFSYNRLVEPSIAQNADRSEVSG
ncbi:uncharacterized protein LOC125708418 isoform X3 [Brienomyrus brachyistius]|uniref:uncharacterized protein LOC125708418 isoform X3 n=1 Tax=Brienomyrus brachyistius TaxID=42636 RepID=UPI0020B2A41C|nr:uncharacterized protein LOC125708418 isoform X3 [Brienomyrus brachyistius]